MDLKKKDEKENFFEENFLCGRHIDFLFCILRMNEEEITDVVDCVHVQWP